MNSFQVLNMISKMEHDWDGHGGLPVSKKCIDTVLEYLIDTYPLKMIIYPNPNGTISLEIKDHHIEIGEHKYLLIYNNETTHGDNSELKVFGRYDHMH